jgi:hypothetical protein
MTDAAMFGDSPDTAPQVASALHVAPDPESLDAQAGVIQRGGDESSPKHLSAGLRWVQIGGMEIARPVMRFDPRPRLDASRVRAVSF